ncbi:REP-associated tyrosine transposase [Tenacibaculum amylolyticum]|uniref:REP-associated tyrosine transposase n=1 Tax=Tenacibaculum amylolyticum TaxID=104269 RepID=UPI0038961D48
MSTKYKVKDNQCYFITITTVGWVDIFTRLNQKYVIIKSLDYCQKEKGLEIYAYCLMHSHLHMVCRAEEGYKLSDIIRDLKKYTSKQIIKTIKEQPESRREWMLHYFKESCKNLKRNQEYKVWQDGYHAEILFSNSFLKEKINYIHNNPVKDKVVKFAEDYIFSSARNYADLDNELDIVVDVNILL